MNCRNGDRRRPGGFTLVEVMVALFVLVTALTALLFRITQHVNNSAYLRDKTVATWVAQNQLESVRLESRLNNSVLTDVRSGTETMAGKTWRWRISPQLLPADPGVDDRIIPVQITVADDTAPDLPLVTLTGVTDAWHSLR